MQKITEAFEIYFNKLLSVWQNKFATLPTVCYEEELAELLIVGKPDENDMVQWQPKRITDKDVLSQDVKSLLSPHALDYFASYYFFSTGGKHDNYFIELNQITPYFLKSELQNNLEQYMKFHGGVLNYVPIGIETKSSLIVVLGNSTDNRSVYLEDYEGPSYEKISDDLFDFISKLNP